MRYPQNSGRPLLRRMVLVVMVALGFLTGCHAARVPPVEMEPSTLPDMSELQKQIDEALAFNLHERALNTRDHAAWQVVHGIMAYGEEFPVNHEGKPTPALAFLLGGGTLKGWEFEPGDVLESATGRRGLRAPVQEGTNAGQGHVDQWLGYLSLCNVSPATQLRVGDETYLLSDYLEQARRDVFRNPKREYSWTIMALAHYFPTTATWTAGDGKVWSLEQLVASEAEQDILKSACGGTHRLSGMTVALKRHVQNGGSLTGGWAAADKKIRECIELARANQNPTGAFSTRFLDGPGSSPDANLTLDTSGHVFEFLALAVSDEQLQEPWMTRGAASLCETVRRTRKLSVQSGGLYHAMHGLAVYRERRFGARS